jgi:hypothetical protein
MRDQGDAQSGGYGAAVAVGVAVIGALTVAGVAAGVGLWLTVLA